MMDDTKRVLIVDDDKHISELLKLYFEKDGFEVSSCFTGDAVMPMVRAMEPDVIILDLMLPGLSGFDVMRELRRVSDVPVLMLTARSDTLDKIIGLELGADDYVLKPFEPKELLARVKAVLRRSQSATPSANLTEEKQKDIVSYPDLTVDRIRYSVRVGDREIR